MTDEDIIVRVATLLGVRYVGSRRYKRKKNWKPSFQVQLKGKRAAALMKELRPLMGVRRQGQIDRAVECLVPIVRGCKFTRVEVADIRRRLRAGEKAGDLATELCRAVRTLELIRDRVTWRQVA